MKNFKILIADDDKNIQFAFRKVFERESYDVISADDGDEVIKKIEIHSPNVIFMDISMPKMDGLITLSEIRKRGINTPVILITGYGTMQTAIKAIQLGAYEYISKPLDIDKVYLVAKRALEMVALRDELNELKSTNVVNPVSREMIGQAACMQDVFKTIGAVSITPNTTNVMITGESGTGKELVARAIHDHSESHNQPFIAINCTAITDSLLESELFGHEKGSFTGAIDKKIGKFEIAGSGTIFLDEIGDVSPNFQKKLLRVLQEREFERVGGNKAISIKARFITATNKKLEEEIAKGNFRQDLYYRLNVIHIELPSLRERGQDVMLLLNHFVRKYALKFNKPIDAVSPKVEKFVETYDFPGNVRELENMVERAVAIIKGEILDIESLQIKSKTEQKDSLTFTSLVFNEAKSSYMELFEKKYLKELLLAAENNITKASLIAMVDRKTIQRLMKKHGFYSETSRN